LDSIGPKNGGVPHCHPTPYDERPELCAPREFGEIEVDGTPKDRILNPDIVAEASRSEVDYVAEVRL
jgi:hypothetical protein